MGKRNEVLVVDDELPILQMYRDVLGEAGYAVLTAPSGEEALALVADHPVWVLFLDLKLPGMNGLELCAEIKRQWAMAVCFAVTGYASYFEIHECRRAGFEDYFLKPVRVSDLQAAAAQAFEKLERWRGGKRPALAAVGGRTVVGPAAPPVAGPRAGRTPRPGRDPGGRGGAERADLALPW